MKRKNLKENSIFHLHSLWWSSWTICPEQYLQLWDTVCFGWRGTFSAYSMVSGVYIQRHMSPVYRLCDKEVWRCHSCVWWLLEYQYKGYDTPQTIKGECWYYCDLYSRHDTKNEKGNFPFQQQNKKKNSFSCWLKSFRRSVRHTMQ